MRIVTIAATCVFTLSVATDISAQPAKLDVKPEQLPRVPAKTPEESRRAIVVQPGFRVETVAAEPLVRDPVALDFDEQGRMYVVQLPPYNGYIIKDFNERGSIVRLEDTDGDGQYEKSTPFAIDLNYPTAVACWDGGVFVGDAPDLLYLKDTNGDGQADLRKVVFTGFGKDKAGEAHLNSIRWGLDNRFHLSTNLAGGDVTAVATKPGQAASVVSVRGRGLIFDPRDLTTFELTSGGGQHGMSMDNNGRKFVCSNSVPAQTLMYDDRYIARNPRLIAAAAAVDIAPDGKHTKLYRISPPEPWRVLRTRLRREGAFRGSDEGGKPFGFFTGATGITIYRGDAWPAQYRGNLLVGDVANNLIYRAKLESNGLELIARRADADAEFLASRDIWFRPVQFANAPDGTLFVLDMVRELIEGAAFLPPEFFEHLDAASGNDRGRIYRIAHGSSPSRRPTPNLGQASTAQLVKLLEHPNGWHRDTASRLLYQRQDSAAVASLKQLAAESQFVEGRVTALYSLNGLGQLDEAGIVRALNDQSADVRMHAIRLSEQFSAASPSIRDRLTHLVDDPDRYLRYQLAFSLGAFHTKTSASALSRLALRESNDRWMRLAILSSLGQGADDVFHTLAVNTKYRRSSDGGKLLVELARQIGAAGRNSEIAIVLSSLSTLEASEKTLSEALVQALIEKQSGKVRERILAAAGGKAATILNELLSDAKSKAIDAKVDVADRVDAIRSLRLAPFKDAQPLIEELFELSQPQPVQVAALNTLAEFDDAGVADLLLDVWSQLSPALRARAAETLLSRPKWVHRFLDAVEKQAVGRGDIDPARIQLLRRHPDQQIAARVRKVFVDTRPTNRKAVIDTYQAALKLDGDPARGKLVFKKNCSACHRLEDVGTAVGAELKGIRQRGLPSVLLNILDPNREVKPKFLTYTIATQDGRVLAGMISSETANSITIRRADGTTATVQRIDIDAMSSSGLSFMPEGLEKTIDVSAMSDLLSYLNAME